MLLAFGVALPTAATFIIFGLKALNEGNIPVSVGAFFVAIFPIGAIVMEVIEHFSKKPKTSTK